MEEKLRIVKNIALYLLGIAMFIGGYKIHDEYFDDDSGVQSSVESDGAEESSGSL